MSETQLEFIGAEPTPESVLEFCAYLKRTGWSTRVMLTTKFNLEERQIRHLAEAAGPAVIRGPRGFNHWTNVGAEDGVRCAEIAIAQGRKMMRWGLRVKRLYHSAIG